MKYNKPALLVVDSLVAVKGMSKTAQDVFDNVHWATATAYEADE